VLVIYFVFLKAHLTVVKSEGVWVLVKVLAKDNLMVFAKYNLMAMKAEGL